MARAPNLWILDRTVCIVRHKQTDRSTQQGAAMSVVSDRDLIKPEFTTMDGLTIRYATSPRAGAETVMLLSPWPESIYAYLPAWQRLAEQFSLLAVDLPGFGQSQGRPDLMSTRAMGEFVIRLMSALDVEDPAAYADAIIDWVNGG